MKNISIDNFVILWYDECAVSYAQIMNAICASDTLEELKDAMRGVLKDTEAGKYFAWGYEDNLFWLRQRIEYMGKELHETNVLTLIYS